MSALDKPKGWYTWSRVTVVLPTVAPPIWEKSVGLRTVVEPAVTRPTRRVSLGFLTSVVKSVEKRLKADMRLPRAVSIFELMVEPTSAASNELAIIFIYE